jgi:hypothetical protein
MKLLRSRSAATAGDAELNKSDAVSAKSGKSGKSKRSFRRKKQPQQEHEPAFDDDTKSAGWWNEADADAKTEYSSSTSYTWKEKAVAQRSVVYDHFGDFPKEVLSLNMTSKPEITNSTDVLIKVEVRHVTHQNTPHLVYLVSNSPFSLPLFAIGIYHYTQ